MKKTVISILPIILVSLLFLIFSCETTDETVTITDDDSEMTEDEYSELKRMKALVDKYGLKEFVPEDAQAAEEKYQEVENLYGTDKKAARKAYLQARAKYLVVMEKALPLFAEKRKKETDEIKISAEKIKANVAVKEEYQEALELYNQALLEKEAGNYEKSAELMEEAKAKFDVVYKMAKEKKDKSDSAIDKLNKEQLEYEKDEGETEESSTTP